VDQHDQTKLSDSQPDAVWTGADEMPVRDLFARIESIEIHTGDARDRARLVLDAYGSCLHALAGICVFSSQGEDVEVRSEDGPTGVAAWIPVLRSTAVEAQSRGYGFARVFGSKTAAPEFAVVVAPLRGKDDAAFGAVAVLCRCRGDSDAEQLHAYVRSSALLVSNLLRPNARRMPEVSLDDFARVYQKAADYRSLDEFAYAITNAATQRFGCEQAVFARVDGHRVRTKCISGLDHVKRRSPGVHHVEQAMGECVDAGQPVVAQASSSWLDDAVVAEGRLHQHWRAACVGAAVMSLPIRSGDRIVAVLSLRRGPDEHFEAEEVRAMVGMLTPLGSAIPLIDRSTRPLPRHATDSARQGIHWLMQPHSIRRTIAVCAAIVGAIWFAFAPSTYRIATAATVVAAEEYIVTAPIDERLTAVHVRAGELVEKGQALATMNTDALLLEAEGLRSEIRRANVRMREALDLDDPAAAAVARAERAVYRARLAETEQRIAAATIVAPVAGVIIGAGIDDLDGRIMPKGETLFTIADQTSMHLDLDVPESRIDHVNDGALVRFASHARPEETVDGTLVYLAAAGTELDRSTFFLGKSSLSVNAEWLRPGMEGVAVIDAGEKPNWWIACHRLLDAARLHFWID